MQVVCHDTRSSDVTNICPPPCLHFPSSDADRACHQALPRLVRSSHRLCFLQRPSHKKVSQPLAGSVTAQQLVSRLKDSIGTNGPTVPSSSLSGQTSNVCYYSGPATKSVTAAGGKKQCVSTPIPGLSKLWPACPKWHEGFTVVPNLFFISFAQPASLYSQHYVYIYCIYTYLTAYRDGKWITTATKYQKNREPCEVFTGYLSLGRRAGGNWKNMWH